MASAAERSLAGSRARIAGFDITRVRLGAPLRWKVRHRHFPDATTVRRGAPSYEELIVKLRAMRLPEFSGGWSASHRLLDSMRSVNVLRRRLKPECLVLRKVRCLVGPVQPPIRSGCARAPDNPIQHPPRLNSRVCGREPRKDTPSTKTVPSREREPWVRSGVLGLSPASSRDGSRSNALLSLRPQPR